MALVGEGSIGVERLLWLGEIWFGSLNTKILGRYFPDFFHSSTNEKRF